MKRPKSPKTSIADPTRSELEILQFLWQQGPSTARMVNDHLNHKKRDVIYMSTLKTMQIMVEKGLLKKDDSEMKHIYRAAVEEGKTKRHLLDRVVETIFNGSAGSLMMQLLGDIKLSAKELAEFKDLVKKIEKK